MYEQYDNDGKNIKARHRIGPTTYFLMMSTAIFVDAVQIILDLAFQIGVVLNRFIDVFVGLMFGVWFMILNVSIVSSPRRFLIFFGTLLLEAVPEIDVAPLWSLEIWLMHASVEAEDLQYNEQVLGIKQSAVRKGMVGAKSMIGGKFSGGGSIGQKPPPVPRHTPPPIPSSKTPPPLPRQSTSSLPRTSPPIMDQT